MIKQKYAIFLTQVAVIGFIPVAITVEPQKAAAENLVPCGDVLPPPTSAFFNPKDPVKDRNNVISSFLQGECKARTIQDLKDAGESLTFYRYFTAKIPGVPGINAGSYITTEKYEFDLDAVKGLALDKSFGNNADSRETADISLLPSDTLIYQGFAGPQPPPPSPANSCYPGGGQQTYLLYKDAVLSNLVKYVFDAFTKNVASDCIYVRPTAQIPEPVSILGTITALGFCAKLKRLAQQRKK